ncbi:cytochrome P450 4c3-like [Tachypleus tridentatus]|uniref:cytochrome P450 4c3-like n=1 Tax=Tachypleus tridentatus TaxID=6853 RepID=UPI003FD29F04
MEQAQSLFPVDFINLFPGHTWRTLALLILLGILLPAVLIYHKYTQKAGKVLKVPGSSANSLIVAFVLLFSFFRNKAVDKNVLFLQTLCGGCYVFDKSRIWRFFMGLRPVALFYKPETVEAILSSNVNVEKSFDYSFIHPWLKEGLVTSGGAKWKSRRKLLTPAFHFRILEDFIPVFDEQSKIMVSKMREKTNDEYMDIVPLSTLCTLDIICETAMGIHLGSQENKESDYVKAMHNVAETFIARVAKPWFWPDFIFYRTRRGKKFLKSTETMDKFTRQVIRARKSEKLKQKMLENEENYHHDEIGSGYKRKRQAFLDLLLEHHLKDNTLTEDDMQEEVDSFMFAGHDTTAVGISWAIYALGLYPDIQCRVQEEVDSIFGDDKDRPITADDLKQMKYMELVLKETQRVFPSAPFIARDLVEDLNVSKYTIKQSAQTATLPVEHLNISKYTIKQSDQTAMLPVEDLNVGKYTIKQADQTAMLPVEDLNVGKYTIKQADQTAMLPVEDLNVGKYTIKQSDQTGMLPVEDLNISKYTIKQSDQTNMLPVEDLNVSKYTIKQSAQTATLPVEHLNVSKYTIKQSDQTAMLPVEDLNVDEDGILFTFFYEDCA